MLKKLVFAMGYVILLIHLLVFFQTEAWATNAPSWIRHDGYDLNAVAWGNGIYIAVGAKGAIVTSRDGNAWARQETGTSNSLYGVAWSGRRFAVVGERGTILASTDGSNWKKVLSASKISFRDIVWGMNRFVAVGDDGAIFTSPGGEVWQKATSGSFASLQGVGVNDRLFVAVGDNATILLSPDGVSWSQVEYPERKEGRRYFFEKVKWIDQQFVIVGSITGEGVTLPIKSISDDASGWFEKTYDTMGPKTVGEGRFFNIARDAIQYIAVGDRGRIYTIPDCAPCARLKTVSGYDLRGIASNGAQFIVVGKGGILTSALPEVELFINGEVINLEAPPRLEKDTFLVPYPNFLASLGVKAVFDERAGSLAISKENISMVLKIGKPEAIINGIVKQIESAPKVIGQKIFIPVRSVAERFGYRVDWDAEGRQINVFSVLERFYGKGK